MTREHPHPRPRLTRADAVIAVLEGDIEELCRLVAERVFGLNPQAYVIVTVYDPTIDAIRVKQMFGFGDALDAMTAELGAHPSDLTFSRADMSAEERELYTSGRLERVPGGLQTMLAGSLPREVIELIERRLGLRSAYTVGFALGTEPYGGVIILQRTQSLPSSPSAIETLANHVAMAIHRQHALEDLGRSEARYRWLAESVSDLIWTIDPDGTVDFANGAAQSFLGLEPERLVGRSIFDFMTEPASSAVRELLSANPVEVQGRLLEVDYLRADGKRLPAEVRIGRVPPGDPRLRYLGVSRDLTERRRLEAERRALEERRHRAESLESIGRLAGGVAHDLNNRLVPILGHAELLLTEQAAPGTEQSESLGAIMEAAESARSLVRQLLAFGRRQPLTLDRVFLDDVMCDVEPLLRRTLPESMELEVRTVEDLPPVRADRSELERVIVNLVANAKDAMEGRGLVRVETGVHSFSVPLVLRGEEIPPGEYVVLSIEDTGHGMTDDEAELIFEPFFTTRADRGGTGLGLSTVHGIVRQHGGGIRVHTAPGRGTRFEVILPADATRDEVVPTEPSYEDERLEGTESLLLVEDDESVRTFIARALRRFGYAVFECSSVYTALDVARDPARPVDLLLTDVVMPSLDGRELLALVSQERPRVRALLMSGYASRELEQASPQTRTFELIRKPFTARELVRRVRQVLDDPAPPAAASR